jgi:hypothetical protein
VSVSENARFQAAFADGGNGLHSKELRRAGGLGAKNFRDIELCREGALGEICLVGALGDIWVFFSDAQRDGRDGSR